MRDRRANMRCARSRSIRTTPRRSAIYAHVCAFSHQDFDTALHYFDRALRLNPNLAFIWALSALTYCYLGEPETALARLERYRDLAPFASVLLLFENVYAIALHC